MDGFNDTINEEVKDEDMLSATDSDEDLSDNSLQNSSHQDKQVKHDRNKLDKLAFPAFHVFYIIFTQVRKTINFDVEGLWSQFAASVALGTSRNFLYKS